MKINIEKTVEDINTLQYFVDITWNRDNFFASKQDILNNSKCKKNTTQKMI